MVVDRTLAAFGAAAARTGDTLGPPDGLVLVPLVWYQDTVQHLADGAMFAVERVGVHFH